MYTEHFGLTADPFSLTPDPAFLYLSPDHREALAAVQYGILDGRGFVTLVGEVGTGKTTLLYSILARRHPGLEAAYVSYSAQRFEELLASALRDLRIEAAATDKAALLAALNDHLTRRADENCATALIIDEAQNLDDETFEELRLLSNFETYSHKLLQIVLVGQPELQDRLRRPGLRQLRERVSVRAYVNPLARDEMEKYIAHRLERVGGAASQLFTPRALRIIVRRTGGIPRRANILCHTALLFAFGRHRDVVTHLEAREAVRELDERRAGWLGLPALRRVPFRPGAWNWATALGAAFLLGVVGSQLWSRSPGSPAARPVAEAAAAHDTLGALEPGAAVAATRAPEAPAAAPAPPEQPARSVGPAAPVPAAVAVAAVPAAPRAAVEPPVPARAPADDSRVVVVPRGTALWKLLREVYGSRALSSNQHAIYERVRELNPQLSNINRIGAGDRLRLPRPPSRAAGEKSS